MDDKHHDLADVLRAEYAALRPGQTPVEQTDALDVDAARAAIQIQMLEDEQGLTALCLSGGGIRSATFGLGVIQGLAKLGLLKRFDYLSTVSGGGYLGGWLSAWAQRHPQGIEGVTRELVGDPTSSAAPEQEPVEVRHLRQYSNYLAPRLGPLSVDAWTLVSIYLRNLSLNWLVILPLLFLLLAVPRMYMQAMHWAPDKYYLLGAGVLIALLMLQGLNYVGADRPSGGGRNRDQRHFIWGCLAPLGISVLLISLAWVWFQRAMTDQYQYHWLYEWWFIVPFSALVYLFSWLRHIFAIRRQLVGRIRTKKIREGVAALASGCVAGLLVWVWTRLFEGVPGSPLQLALYTCFAAPLLWTIFTLAETVFIGLSSRVTGDDDREWWARSGAWILIALNLWLSLSLIVVFGPELVSYLWQMAAAVGGASGMLTYWAARSTLNSRRSVREPEQGQDESGFSSERLARLVLKIAAPLSVLAILILIAYISDAVLADRLPTKPGQHLALLGSARLDVLVMVCLSAIGICLVMSPFINVNRFSLHAMYRNRLIRAYLGASRPRKQTNSPTRNNFTGFDPPDNLDMHQLWPNKASSAQARAPLHVVNIALNLVSGEDLAWQQRKAASFTVTPLHSGGCCVGYRTSDEYGGGDGISLGTAITISGAAASPSMGYHTRPSLSFLLSLFNARLGWWLGNPKDDKTWSEPGPRFSIAPLRDEMLGLTNDKNPWVYLSDGGHFENLGLYEMIQRRCRLIVVSDAGADPQCNFEDLGNALRKIRADLGVRIELEGGGEECKIGIHARNVVQDINRYCALFSIFYTEAAAEANKPDGRLLYIKAAVYGQEPLDVCNYAREHAEFPHEPTSDQFFTESQFESYRHLGEHVIQTIAGGGQVRDWELQDLFAAATLYCNPTK